MSASILAPQYAMYCNDYGYRSTPRQSVSSSCKVICPQQYQFSTSVFLCQSCAVRHKTTCGDLIHTYPACGSAPSCISGTDKIKSSFEEVHAVRNGLGVTFLSVKLERSDSTGANQSITSSSKGQAYPAPNTDCFAR